MSTGADNARATEGIDLIVDEHTAAKIKGEIHRAHPKDFVVLPQNWATVNLWVRLCHLWVFGVMGGLRSLDWSAVLAKVNLIETRSEERFSIETIEGIEVMEIAAINAINKRLDRKK